MRQGLGWMVRRGEVNELRGKKKEVERMRKGLSVIAGVAVLLFAYSASADVVTNGLVSWWKFDEESGTTAADGYEGPNYNTGTLVDFPDPATWTTDTAGVASHRALDFDGSSNYVDCGNHNSLVIPNAITLEAWVKLDRCDTTLPIIQKGRYIFRGMSPGKIEFNLTIDAVARKCTYWLNLASFLDEWHHLVATYDSSEGERTMRVYDNTNLVASTALSGLASYTIADINAAVEIGRHGGAFFDGTIDEVRIYNEALSQNDIQQNYNAIPEPSTFLLLGGGLLGLLALRRGRKR